MSKPQQDVSIPQHFHCYGIDCYGIDIFYIFFYLNNDYSLKHRNKSDFLLKLYLVKMLKSDFFLSNSIVHFCVTVIWHKKKYTIKISLTKTVFSFASSVDALQNTCILSKQKVSN